MKRDNLSPGIIPTLGIFYSACKFVDQGGNKILGARSVTLKPLHANILGF